ncbi:hypothetical protein WMF20_00745 [Sorangium sp. So ce834]|uniref:hypothetical protein n=1 Tax=Sorangium sp. So ce834 TaxID=3133321 RepID=UPI003F5E6D04
MKHERIWLSQTGETNEKWLQDRLSADTSMLGLGDLLVRDRERRQERAGRLDLLLEDPDSGTRYEVELMLGPLDESHIVRAIEYWDIERRRYPAYEHCAVIVAEDVTSRFLNVLSLLSGTIPLVVLQLNALRVADGIVLHFSKILDQRELRDDDSSSLPDAPTSRADWVGRASNESVALAEKVLSYVNEKAKDKFELNFNKHYVGLKRGPLSNNFVVLWPRKKHLLVGTYFDKSSELATRLRDAGLTIQQKGEWVRASVSHAEFAANEALLREMIHAGVVYNAADK